MHVLFALALIHQAHGQCKISGKVMKGGGEPVPFANALLLNAADSALAKGTLTTETGAFVLEAIKPGTYFISVSSVGYKSKNTPVFSISPTDRTIEPGVIQLEEDVNELSEVRVEAAKPLFEQKIDRTVVNVASSITLSGGTALDVLERSPGVNVNRQTNTLSLSGKDGITVMINGKITRLPTAEVVQMLNGMNAGNIERIELITNPPSKYDAESSGGIINIVLRKSEDYGTNGSYKLIAGYGFYEKTGISGNINHKTKKVNFFSDLSAFRGHTRQNFTNYRTTLLEDNSIDITTVSQREPIVLNFNGRAGFDYTLSKKTMLSGLVAAYSNQWMMDADNAIAVQSSKVPASAIQSRNSEINRRDHIMANLNLNHALSEEQNIEFDVDFLQYYVRNPSTYRNDYFNQDNQLLEQEELRIFKKTPITLWTAKADYTRNFGKNVKLESGLKGALARFTNDISLESKLGENWVRIPENSGKYWLREDIGAAYSTLNVKLNPKTTLNAGLRYEHTITLLDGEQNNRIVDRNFGNLFPSLFFSRDLTKQSTFQFSYGRRITRPTYNDLAPFVIFLDPFTYFTGNNFLTAAVTDVLKADFRHKNYLFSLQYNHDDNAIARYQPQIITETNEQIFSSINLDYQDTYTLLMSLPVHVNSWWSMQNNVMLVRQVIETQHLTAPRKLSENYFRVNFNQTFSLPSRFSLEVSGFYQSTRLLGVARTLPYGSVDLGLQKKFENGATLNLTLSDTFWTFYTREVANIPEENLNITTVYRYEPRIVRLTYSQNFGNAKLKGSRKRSTSSEEERKRVD